MRPRTRAPRGRSPIPLVVLTLLAVTAVSPATAQTVVEGTSTIDFDRPESWAMKYFARVTMPGTFGAPEPLAAGELDLALEYGQVPSLSASERRVGFNGTKIEDLNKAPYFVRPVVRLGVGKKVALAASYLPPVEWNGAEANVLTLTLARPLLASERWRLGLRLRGQLGQIDGDFTCSEQTVAAGADPAGNPLGCEEVSSDEYRVESLGLEFAASWSPGEQDRWRPYASLSLDHSDLEFRVDARYSGIVDRTRLVTDGETWAASAGISYRASARWELAGELHYAPLEVARPPAGSSDTEELLNARALLRYHFD